MNKKKEQPLKIIPIEVVNDLIIPYLQDKSKDFSNLMLLNRKYSKFFEAQQHQRLLRALFKYISNEKQDIAHIIFTKHPEFKIDVLLWCIASGNQNEAEKMLKNHPELVLERGFVIDF